MASTPQTPSHAGSPRSTPTARSAHAALFSAKSAQAPAAAAAPPAATVSVATVKRADYPVYLDGLGQVQAENTVTVRSRVDGQITKIAFAEGQMVKAGDLLAQIDPRPFQAALDQAKAKQAQDQATLANAKLDLQRYARSPSRASPPSSSSIPRTLWSTSSSPRNGRCSGDPAAQVQLDYTTIVAPLSGRVGFRLIDQGNMVSAAQQTSVVTIAQLEPITVVFTAPQDELPAINAAMAAGAPDRSAHLRWREAAGDRQAYRRRQSGRRHHRLDPPQSGVRQPGPHPVAWPGGGDAVEVAVDKNALTIPDIAVQRGPNGLFVYFVGADNRATPRPVTLAPEDAEVAVVSKGLNEGDRVVTVGHFGLQPGARVIVQTSVAGGS